MACGSCPGGPTYVERDTRAISEPHSQVDHGPTIPVFEGHPLSSACERDNLVGQIPETRRFPGFTMVRGQVVQGVPSNGGIQNMVSFFGRAGSVNDCYSGQWSQLASNCC